LPIHCYVSQAADGKVNNEESYAKEVESLNKKLILDYSSGERFDDTPLHCISRYGLDKVFFALIISPSYVQFSARLHRTF
jgi:hypothetical protein